MRQTPRAALLLLTVAVPCVVAACGGSGALDADGGADAPQGNDGGAGQPDSAAESTSAERFSFFVTSLAALRELSGSELGFGGDLSYGETGPGAGLRGADKICATIAERSMPGAGKKPWRAFLSAVSGVTGAQVNAIDRIGDGPWYDRLGRRLAASQADLLFDRPQGGDPAIKDDFPNEDGVPNHRPDPTKPPVDNHDMLTGTNGKGELYGKTATCKDWTSARGDRATEGRPRVGHAWPRRGGPPGGGPDGGPDGGGPDGGGPGGMVNPANWMSSLDESGCAPGVNLAETGGPMAGSTTVGSGGGYGGFYCFALVP